MGVFSKLFGSKTTVAPIEGTAELMPEETFWEIIFRTNKKSWGNYEQQQKLLLEELKALHPVDIMMFHNRFIAMLGSAHNTLLWAAAHIINGDCGADSFSDFRGWLIAQGKHVYTRTLAQPDTLADFPNDLKDVQWEGIDAVAAKAFKELTLQDMPVLYAENTELAGPEWNHNNKQAARLLPALWAKFH